MKRALSSCGLVGCHLVFVDLMLLLLGLEELPPSTRLHLRALAHLRRLDTMAMHLEQDQHTHNQRQRTTELQCGQRLLPANEVLEKGHAEDHDHDADYLGFKIVKSFDA